MKEELSGTEKVSKLAQESASTFGAYSKRRAIQTTMILFIALIIAVLSSPNTIVRYVSWSVLIVSVLGIWIAAIIAKDTRKVAVFLACCLIPFALVLWWIAATYGLVLN